MQLTQDARHALAGARVRAAAIPTAPMNPFPGQDALAIINRVAERIADKKAREWFLARIYALAVHDGPMPFDYLETGSPFRRGTLARAVFSLTEDRVLKRLIPADGYVFCDCRIAAHIAHTTLKQDAAGEAALAL